MVSRSVTLDYYAIERQLMTWAEKAMVEAQAELVERAQERAPVRKLFKGASPRGATARERVPRGIMRRNGQVFGRRVTHWTDRARDRFMKQVNAQTVPRREARIPTFDPVTNKPIGSERVRGNAATWRPLVSRNGVRTTGDFRSTGVTMKGRVRMRDTLAYDEGSTKPRVQRGADTEKEMMSARGRMELKNINKQIDRANEHRLRRGQRKLTTQQIQSMMVQAGQKSSVLLKRANAARASKGLPALKSPARPGTGIWADGQSLSLGGRLRGEIHATPIHWEGNVLVGEVVSPTFYAKYQEYGTSRHRAQPFMRPALYEMRQRLPKIMARTIRSERGL